MTYAQFLAQLYSIMAAAGAKIPQLIAALQQLLTDLQDPAFQTGIKKIEADVQDIAGVVIGKTIAIPHAAGNPALEKTLENHFVDLVATHGGHGVPTNKGPILDIVKNLWGAVQNNPAMMQLIMTLLAGLIKA